MKYKYKTHGTCSREIEIDIDGKNIKDVKFTGGCDGNTKGLSALIRGMDIEHVIDRCEGIKCGRRSTSCPDQLALALKEAKEEYQRADKK